MKSHLVDLQTGTTTTQFPFTTHTHTHTHTHTQTHTMHRLTRTCTHEVGPRGGSSPWTSCCFCPWPLSWAAQRVSVHLSLGPMITCQDSASPVDGKGTQGWAEGGCDMAPSSSEALSSVCFFQRGRNIVSYWAPRFWGSAPTVLVSRETRSSKPKAPVPLWTSFSGGRGSSQSPASGLVLHGYTSGKDQAKELSWRDGGLGDCSYSPVLEGDPHTHKCTNQNMAQVQKRAVSGKRG